MRTYLILIALFFTATLSAQIDLTSLYSNNANIGNSNIFPAALGDDMATVQVDLIQVYAYAGVNTFNRRQLEDLLNTGSITNTTVDNLLTQLSSQTNQTMSGLRIQPLNVSIRASKRLAFGFGVQERPEVRLAMDAKILDVLWNGNAQYEDQNIDLGRFTGNFNYVRELYVAGAYNLINGEKTKLRLGSRLKVLQSIASVYAPDNNVSLYTAPNGRYLDFTYNYRVNTGYPSELIDSIESYNPLQVAGTGFGVDLGANISLGRLQAAIGITDIGAAQFSDDVNNYFNSDTFRFEGIVLNNIADDVSIDDSAFIAQLADINQTQESYLVPLPAKVAVQAAFRSKKKVFRDHEYYAKSLFVTFVQGLDPRSTFGTNTIASVGASYDLFGVLNVGANVSTLNFNKLRVGGFLSMRLLILRVGVGSSNLLPLVLSNSDLSSDLHINVGINF